LECKEEFPKETKLKIQKKRAPIFLGDVNNVKL
jgi:hypothetical protein